MSDLSLAIIPLTIVPGVALILSSSAARFNVVAGQINRLYLSQEKHNNYIIKQQLLRSRLFTNILTCLYISIFSLLLSSFIGIINASIFQDFAYSEMILIICFSLGIFFALAAVILLIIEATTIRKVIRKKIELIRKQK
ncbi:DUF2721 domain-containing protein [Candidatus Gracilibacteria bacterium]|nr:DUF2721 domain-containing protein [Candidatus Gracilibacteria bacterium]